MLRWGIALKFDSYSTGERVDGITCYIYILYIYIYICTYKEKLISTTGIIISFTGSLDEISASQALFFFSARYHGSAGTRGLSAS